MAQPVADPYAHLPSEDIDVEDPTQHGYQIIMNWMDERNVTRAGGNSFRNIPITSATTGFRRINLIHAGKPAVSLIIDERDSYLIAFRRGDGMWLHFSDKELPPGGQGQRVEGRPIQLDSSYMDLIRETERPYFSVGKHSLNHTYHVLLNYDERVALGTPKMNKQRKALTQLIVMFCEASRFNPLYDLILETMGSDRTDKLEHGVWVWINNWSSMSAFAKHCSEVEASNGAPTLDPAKIASVAQYLIENGDGVARVLRLILST